jgi:hypothetical protein
MQPQRIQYPYVALTEEQRRTIIGKNRPLAHVLAVQDQWGIFERIENYNDVIYQKYQQGDRSQLYYQFVNDQERNDYRAGQQFHSLAYPNLPESTFQSIRDRPMPDVPLRSSLPYETNVPRFAINQITPSASELAAAQADLEIYTFVSSFNSLHQIKYTFANDVEKNAYERVELQLNAI